MATFKDIEAANKSIKPMKISRWDKKQGKEISKDYAEVNQRIKAFRMIFPEGFIRTSIVSHNDGVVIMRSEAGYTDEAGNEHILGTGHAFENQKNGMINGTSYIENCETSAVGRALGMIALGIDMGIASYEEVSNAMAQQANNSNASYPPEPPVMSKADKMIDDLNTYTCYLCNNVFHDHMTADATYKKFKKYLCPDCVKKKTEEAMQKKKSEENQLPFQI